MIFFGRRASRIKNGQINNVTCPHCETITSMHYSVFGKYAHVYWIPTFPMGKTSVLECNHCKRTFEEKELTDQIQHKFKNESQGASYPFWYFSGLLGIFAIILMGMYWSKQDDKDNSLFIQNPQVGDVYSFEVPETGHYSSLKVSEVTSDSLFLIANDYEIDRRSKIYKIDKKENYTGSPDGYSKAEIQQFFEEGIIYDVDRN